MEIRKPKYSVINKYQVTITSLKTQLKNASGIDELTEIANAIVDLETKIAIEKSEGYQQIEEEKTQLESKIDKLQKKLRKYQAELAHLKHTLDIKLQPKEKLLQTKIEELNIEYHKLLNEIKSKK